MTRNPYLLADQRQARARRREVGMWVELAPWSVVLAVLAAFPLLLRTVFSALGSAGAATHTADLVVRLGLLLAAGMSISSYSLLVRGPDRGVIDPHPLLAGPWYAARVRRLYVEQLPWLVAALVFLGPGTLAGVPPWAPVVAVAGAWAAGIGVGAGVSLKAPQVALDPRYAPWLDVLRGNNPRMQAALIWAPGAALGLSGAASLLASIGVELALHGAAVGWLLVLLPWGAAVVGLLAGRRGAPTVERLPGLLGEIDAAWAAVESPEERHHVPYDWALRWVPAGWRRDLLRELRHLGRGLRIWQSAGWGAALAVAAAGWVPAPDGRGPLAAVGLGAVALVAFGAVRAGATDPPWLESWLGLRPARLVAMRALAIGLAVQPALLAGALAGLVRNGVGALLVVGRLEVLGLLCALAAAAAGARWRARGWMAYVPAAVLIWALGSAA